MQYNSKSFDLRSLIFCQASLGPMIIPRTDFHLNLRDEGDGPGTIYRGMPQR